MVVIKEDIHVLTTHLPMCAHTYSYITVYTYKQQARSTYTHKFEKKTHNKASVDDSLEYPKITPRQGKKGKKGNL